MARIYVCREGVARSALALNEGAGLTDAEWRMMKDIGLTRAVDGQRYLKRVSCPVNGDFYEYWRVELLDSNGCVVGSRPEES